MTKKISDYVIINWKNNQSVSQLSRQAGRQRVAVSSERKSFNISISNSIFYSGDNIHHYHYFYHFLIYEHLKWQKLMLGHLFPNAALFLHVYHKNEVEDISCSMRIALASNFLISSFVRRNSQDILHITIYLFLLLRLHVINCYMRAAVCIWLVLARFTVSFPIPYKIVTIHRTLSEHTFLNTWEWYSQDYEPLYRNLRTYRKAENNDS